MRSKEKIYLRNRNDEYFMPDTQRQGWGSITGQKTQVSESEDGGTRVITRTPL